jgi:hypothetical protein
MLYGMLSVIEGTIVYLLAQLVCRRLETPIPPIGSREFVGLKSTRSDLCKFLTMQDRHPISPPSVDEV